MARLPQIGGDNGNWGNLLNEFLSVEHASDGTLLRSADIASRYDKPPGGIPENHLAVAITNKLNGLITDAEVATNAAIAQSKIASLTSDLASKASTSDTRLTDARIIVEADGVAAGPARHKLSLKAGTNVALNVIDSAANDQIDVISSLTINPSTNLTPNWVNVLDYGAKTDATGHNDTAAFQAAIADLRAAGGGVLYLPRGQYRISGELDVSGPIHVLGEGQKTTILCSELSSSGGPEKFLFNMQPTDTPSSATGSIQRLNINGPGSGVAPGNYGVRQAWVNGIKMSRGGLVKDVQLNGFNAGFYMKYGRERLTNIRASSYNGVYFTSSDPDSGGAHILDTELLGGQASVGVAPTGTILNCFMSGVQLGHCPFAFYKEGPAVPSYDTFISGLTMISCQIELAGNGLFVSGDNSGNGQTIENLSVHNSNPYNLMNLSGGSASLIHDAPIICGTIRNWQIFTGFPLGWAGDIGIIICKSMQNVYFESVTGGTSKPLIICDGPLSGNDFRVSGLRIRPMKCSTTLSSGDLVEADAVGGCKKYVNGVVVGVCLSTAPVTPGDIVLIAFAGYTSVKVVTAGSITRTSKTWLKPDPANSGCAIQATGPQDGAVFGMATTDVSGGRVNCYLYGLT